MKRRILLFSAVAGAFSLALSSYHDGMIAHPGTGATNLTKSATPSGFGTLTCADGSGCHSSNGSGLALNIKLEDMAGNIATGFWPGRTYKIILQGQYTGPDVTNLGYFGFQTALLSWNIGNNIHAASPLDPTQIGSVSPSNVTHGTYDGATLYEQTATLRHPVPPGSNLNSYDVEFTWDVPAGTAAPDSIAVYSTICAVQNTTPNIDSDRLGLTSAIYYNAQTNAVANVFKKASFKSYPNPVNNELHIQMDNMQSGSYMINAYDMMGRVVFSQPIMVNGGSYTANINTSNWASGIYQVQISQGNAKHAISVVKQ